MKKKAAVILLRNLNISGGLCNGTRLIIDDVINERLIKATIASGEYIGRIVLIPKILNQSADDATHKGSLQVVMFVWMSRHLQRHTEWVAAHGNVCSDEKTPATPHRVGRYRWQCLLG